MTISAGFGSLPIELEPGQNKAGVDFLVHEMFVYIFQFNFVGRILGPRGMTAKQLEQDTGCKIMVRGMGSMRDKKKVGRKPR